MNLCSFELGFQISDECTYTREELSFENLFQYRSVRYRHLSSQIFFNSISIIHFIL